MPPLGKPVTLTRQQYRGTAAGKKKGASYGNYLSFLARHRPQRMDQNAAIRNDPLTPLTEGQVQARARTDVHSQVDPLVAEIARTIGARTKAGMGAIGGYTQQLAGQLGGYQQSAANIYGQAQQSQAGTDAALAQMLSGQGSDLAAGLASKLGQAGLGQPIIDKTTGQVQQAGSGSGAALYGTGSAGMTDLIAQGASAQDYAAKLPGIARLGGLQQAGQLQQQSASDLATETGKITSQIPGAVTTAVTAYRNNELDKALARQANEGKAVQAAQNAAKANADLTYKYDALNAGQAKAATAEAGRNARAAAAITSREKAAATKKAAAQKKTASLTPAQKVKLKRDADKFAETAYWGVEPKKHYDSNSGAWVDQPGTGTPALNYQKALKRLMDVYGYKLAEAQQILNNYYAPGEAGRPLKSYQERQAEAQQKGRK